MTDHKPQEPNCRCVYCEWTRASNTDSAPVADPQPSSEFDNMDRTELLRVVLRYAEELQRYAEQPERQRGGEAGPVAVTIEFSEKHPLGIHWLNLAHPPAPGMKLYVSPPAAQPLPAGGVDENDTFDKWWTDGEQLEVARSGDGLVDEYSAAKSAWLARSRLSRGEGREAK